MEKQLLFSLSKDKGDFRVEPYRGSGKGGQKRNKTMSACRIYHDASGAVGRSEDERYFPQNRKIAFKRLIESKEFQRWNKVQAATIMGAFASIEDEVDREMRSKNLKVEEYIDGKWIEIK
jgi:protein subunit release factor B